MMTYQEKVNKLRSKISECEEAEEMEGLLDEIVTCLKKMASELEESRKQSI